MAIDTTLGGATTEGYVDANAVIAYALKHVDRYNAIRTANAEQVIEPAIRRATAWVDGLGMDPANEKSHVWPGNRKTGSQRREWPRANATYVDGTPLDSDTVPPAILDSTCEAACYDITNPNTLHGSIILSEVTKSSKTGPLSESTMGAKTIEEARACLTLVKDYLASILQEPNDSSNFMFETGNVDVS